MSNEQYGPLGYQPGGNHYIRFNYQPVEFISDINANFFEGNIIKYISRYKFKGCANSDIDKAIHYIKLNSDLQPASNLKNGWNDEMEYFCDRNELPTEVASAIIEALNRHHFTAIEMLEDMKTNHTN